MKNNICAGALYVVATPIGNISDITLRAIEHFKSADIIFAEDTRVTKKLLSYYNIEAKQVVSCHEHNEDSRINYVLESLRGDQIVVLTSDAGTPLICDPGYVLVNAVRNAGFDVVPIPGVSAFTTALSAAGIATDKFCFNGFLNHSLQHKKKQLEAIKDFTGTSIFYDSVHRIKDTLAVIDEIMQDRHIVVAKELTKTFERFVHGCAKKILNDFVENPKWCKGEFVLLISGAIRKSNDDQILIEQKNVLEILLAEMPIKQAVSVAVKLTKYKKNDLYKLALDLSKED